jgi:hypothetical protein
LEICVTVYPAGRVFAREKNNPSLFLRFAWEKPGKSPPFMKVDKRKMQLRLA